MFSAHFLGHVGFIVFRGVIQLIFLFYNKNNLPNNYLCIISLNSTFSCEDTKKKASKAYACSFQGIDIIGFNKNEVTFYGNGLEKCFLGWATA